MSKQRIGLNGRDAVRANLTRVGLLLLAGTLAWSQPNGKLSRDLPDKGGQKVDVIIQFNAPPGQRDLSSVNGGAVKRNLPRINGAVFSMPAKALKGLANNPRIKYVSPDRLLSPSLDLAKPAVIANLPAQFGWDGEGVGVAVIDSGIGNHVDFGTGTEARVVYRESFLGTSADQDGYGHGTHVAGAVAGNGKKSEASSNETVYPGIAPQAKLIDLQVLDGEGKGTDSGVIAALQRAIELKDVYDIRVVNLSLGRPVYESYATDPLCQAVEAAWDAGLVVVVAAGNLGRDNSFNNEGYGTITSPGNHPKVITVGAMKTMFTNYREDDRIASYSSKGPSLIDHVVKPDILAPGNMVVSTLVNGSEVQTKYPENVVYRSEYTNSSGPAVSKDYFRLSGTSMAAPMVSGAAALLLEKEPTMTPDQVKARLMKTAFKTFPTTSSTTDSVTGQTYTSQYDIFTVGAGYLDVNAALNSSDLAEGPSWSPQAVYNPITGTVSLVFDNSVIWGTNVVWGTSVIWGTQTLVLNTSVIWGTGVVWGTGVIWGTESPWGSSVIWGTDHHNEAMSVISNGE